MISVKQPINHWTTLIETRRNNHLLAHVLLITLRVTYIESISCN